MARRDSILVSKTLYQVSVITLIAAIAWVGIGIYLALMKSTAVEVDKSMLEPITTTINQDTVKSLSTRLKIEDLLISPTEATASASESATINEEEAR